MGWTKQPNFETIDPPRGGGKKVVILVLIVGLVIASGIAFIPKLLPKYSIEEIPQEDHNLFHIQTEDPVFECKDVSNGKYCCYTQYKPQGGIKERECRRIDE